MKAFRTQSSRLWIFKRLVMAIILVTVLGLGDKVTKIYVWGDGDTSVWYKNVLMCS